MFVAEKEKYTLVKPTENTVKEFFIEFKNNYSKFEDQHIIIDFSEKFNTNIEELLLFLDISNKHRKNSTSFVLVCKGLNSDDILDEINIIPTFTEAIDILEMDAIERDLGF